MRQKLELKKTRINCSVLDEISKYSEQDVCIEKSISEEDIIVKGQTIGLLDIKNTNFKFNISFINCMFTGDVSLVTLKCNGNLAFVNCEMRCDFTAYDISAENTSLQIIKCKINGDLFLENVKCKHIELSTITADKITITSGESSCIIEKISISSLVVASLIKITNIDDLIILNADDVFSPAMLLQHVKTTANASISFNACRIDDLNIDLSKIDMNSRVTYEKCTCINLGLTNNTYKSSKVVVGNSLMTGTLTITGVEERDTYFDISTSNPININIDNYLTDFISDSNAKTPLFNEDRDIPQRVRTLKMLKTAFANDHQYLMEDSCFYKLKTAEARLNTRKKHHVFKILSYLSYLLGRYMFGWGVKITNPIITLFLSMQLSTIFNYLTLALDKSINTVEYLGQKLTGIYASEVLTILTFFGQQADVKLSSGIPIYILISEFLFGLIMTTLIVGILIRKLVR
ncbi:MAG: hypothetical protein Q9M11_03840 [Mariprofundaceae bacterium]|nr:hypothetical protein [Mariprofundaceae bacterium]